MGDSISLDELIALNDEIAALVRAGIPLELGLAGWGRSLPGKLGRIVTQVSGSIAQGKSLPQSLAEPSAPFPPLYRALVTAGMRSGRLSSALESLAISARNLQEVRRSVSLAFLYPLALALLGYFLFWFLLTGLLPNILLLYDQRPPQFWLAVTDIGRLADRQIPIPLTDRVILAGWLPPLLLLVVVAIVWVSSRRATVLGRGGRWLAWVPFAGRTLRQARMATMAEVAALLVEHDVPLGEAVVLAADCTAERRLMRTARQLATSLEQGGSPPTAESLTGFPPLLAWLVSAGGRQETFVTVARHVADTYRRRMRRESRWLREVLPVWLIVVVGGGVVLLYTITTFLPFTELMQRLAEAVGGSMRIRP